MRNKATSQCVCLTVMLLMIGNSSHAQVWDTIPPPLGGMVLSTARSGTTHYALVGSERTDLQFRYYASLYRSVDDGEHWELIPLPLTETKTNWCNRLALDGPDRLYYQTENGVYRTTDGGTTWTDIGACLNSSGSIMEIVIDDSGRLYLLSLTIGIVTSVDRGNTWSSCTLPSGRKLMSAIAHITCIQEDLFQWWYGGYADADTLFRSTDHGTSWSPFLIGRNPLAVIDGGDGRVLVSQVMLGSAGAVPFRILSTDTEGQNWDTLYSTESISGYLESAVERHIFRRSETGTIAHITYNPAGALHFLISVDDGETWSTFENRSADYYDAVGFNDRGQLLIYGSNLGFFRYRNIPGDPELIGFAPLAMNHPTLVLSDGTIYAPSEARSCARIHMWDMSLRSWTMLPGPPIRVHFGPNSSTSVFVAPPDTIYTTNAGLARTTDQGRHWETIHPADQISYGNTSYATGRWFAVSSETIYLSENNGSTWKAVPSPESLSVGRACAVECGSAVLCLSPTGLWRKNSLDSVWIERIMPFGCKAVTTGMDGILFIRNREGTKIARSSDRGDSWQSLPTGFGSVDGLLALSKDTLIALDTTRGIAISPDQGNSWTLIHLPGVMPRSIAMKDRMLYLGTERIGILRTALENVLAPITLVQQLDDEACAPLDLSLAWSAPALSGTFRVRFGTDPSFSASTILLDTLVNGSALTLNNLAPGTRYYWDVGTANSQIGTIRSVVSSFRTAQIPVTEISIPVPGAGCVDLNTEIVWAAIDCADSSCVQISTDPDFRSIESATRVYGATNTATVALAYGTNYYARVRSTTSSGPGPWSPVISFRTIDDTVAAPLQSEPADGSTFTAVPPSFIKWSEVDCVERSEIVTARTPDFSADTVAHEFRQNPNNYITMTGELRKNGTYYWKVRAWRDTVPGYWSPVWSFTLDIPVRVEAAPAADDFRILRIHPQPAGARSGSVTVECAIPASTSSALMVYDMLGRERQQVRIARGGQSRQSIPIDISALVSGQYLIVLQDGARHDVAPLMIMR